MNKILFIPTRFFPSISGAEFYMQRIAEILSANYNYNIDIFTSNAVDFKALRDSRGKIIEKDNKLFDNVNNLSIKRFPVKYGIPYETKKKYIKEIWAYESLNLSDMCLKNLLENGPYTIELIEYFLKQGNLDYDLIHTTFFPYFNLIISLIIGKLFNKPTICTPFFHFSNPRYLNPDLIEVLKKFDLLIACTNLEKRNLLNELSIPEENIKVIPMGVDFKIFEKASMAKYKDFTFKEKFFNKGEKKYKMVLFCGYKNYEKGSISILKAIPHIIDKNKKIYFVFIGPSTMAFNRELSQVRKFRYARIINLTPDNLDGYYDKKKMMAFKEADVYLMPSRSDAFGIAFLEAWAMGKPVIGAKIGATPEVIRENIDGFLTEFDNPKDIAEKVLKLLKSKKLKKKLGSAGKVKVAHHYTWDIIAGKTHEVYQEIINNYK